LFEAGPRCRHTHALTLSDFRRILDGVIRGRVLLSRPRRADGPAGFARVFGRRLRGSISPAAVNSLAQAIQQQEGYYPGSLAYTNNNPGNLVYAGQPGASPGAGGFASFPSYSAGYQALENQITLDATRGTDVNGNPTTTVSQLLTSWAPPSENDTAMIRMRLSRRSMPARSCRPMDLIQRPRSRRYKAALRTFLERWTCRRSACRQPSRGGRSLPVSPA
jgi:hypothetical protein